MIAVLKPDVSAAPADHFDLAQFEVPPLLLMRHGVLWSLYDWPHDGKKPAIYRQRSVFDISDYEPMEIRA